jgi:hypothetical protein
VNVATMFLTIITKIWWKNWVEELEDRRIINNIKILEDMKESLKGQFGMGNQ